LISIIDVTKSYGHGRSEVTALRGVSLAVPAGEKLALVGKSGSGKSTLMNLIGGLDHPSTGSIHVAGSNLSSMSRNEMAAYRRDRVGFVFQSFNLVPSRSALENVELPLIFAGVPKRERRLLAAESLTAVGLGERLEHKPSELSGGEQQRVAIARALIRKPHLLLADEPTGNLDSATAEQILDWLRERLAEHGTTLILVTHDQELAERFSDRVVRMQDGVLAS
jgi:predicted ABC-type transport system involved in lysophospholipase L1 biosynthesis ATPase subunit